jgi:hypothetical protein
LILLSWKGGLGWGSAIVDDACRNTISRRKSDARRQDRFRSIIIDELRNAVGDQYVQYRRLGIGDAGYGGKLYSHRFNIP